MKLNRRITRFQQGGPMPEGAPEGAPMGPEGAPVEGAPEGGAPAPEGGNPEEQLQQIAGQLLDMLMQKIGDPQAVAAILQMALEMVSQGGGQAPIPEEAQPVYQRNGGRLYRIR